MDIVKLYKLTDINYQTLNNTQWGENITHKVLDGPVELCSSFVIHAYEDPRLAVIMNIIHANYNPFVMWEAEGEVVITDGTKSGVKQLTTIKIIEVPKLNNVVYIAFAIYSALEVYNKTNFVIWANNWLEGKDRSATNAANAANAANATYTAYTANATNTAYTAAYAAKAAYAAYAAAKAAYAATYAANAAVYATYAAVYAAKKIDFISLLDKAELIK